MGIEGHHALAVADVDVPHFIHRHAIASPFGELRMLESVPSGLMSKTQVPPLLS